MSDERKELYEWHTELPWAIPVANVFRVVALGEDGEADRCIVEDTAPEDVFFGDKQIGWGEFYDNESDQEYYGREAAANARYIVKACNEYPAMATRIAELESLLRPLLHEADCLEAMLDGTPNYDITTKRSVDVIRNGLAAALTPE